MFGHKNASEDALQDKPLHNPDSCFEGEHKLIVGRGISLNGEIQHCDILVVSGKVEATILGAKVFEVTESGQFRGRVEAERADISGRFDGQLNIRGRLLVRGTGRVSGVLKYGELEVAAGGHVVGELQAASANPQNAPISTLSTRPLLRFPPLSDDEEPPSIFRKTSNA